MRNLKLLGLAALAGAPFLLVDYLTNSLLQEYKPSTSSGIFSLLYISGWMCSVIGLGRMAATGTGRWGKIVLRIQLGLLLLANVSNLWLTVDPGTTHPLYFALDLCWPLSNVWMLATGITILRAGVLEGWRRLVPFVVSLWLPLSILLLLFFGKDNPVIIYLSGGYSALSWSLLALTVFAGSPRPVEESADYRNFLAAIS